MGRHARTAAGCGLLLVGFVAAAIALAGRPAAWAAWSAPAAIVSGVFALLVLVPGARRARAAIPAADVGAAAPQPTPPASSANVNTGPTTSRGRPGTGPGPSPAAAYPPAAAGPAAGPAAGRADEGDLDAGPVTGPATVISPRRLPTFADHGGMDTLKRQLHTTVGTLLALGGAADRYRVSLGGLLLYGPTGAGKTFTARALAGEYRLHLVQVSAADLAAPSPEGPAGPLRRLLAAAAAELPAMLLLDDLDTIARRRDDPRDSYLRLVTGQLLAALETFRGVHELLLVATAADPDALDPAVIALAGSTSTSAWTCRTRPPGRRSSPPSSAAARARPRWTCRCCASAPRG